MSYQLPSSKSSDSSLARVSVPSLLARKTQVLGKEHFALAEPRIVALTAYDYSSAKLIDSAGGVDIILVGDSLANIVQGHENTLPVRLEEMSYHCRCVSRAVDRALVVGDLPFLSYQISPEQALESAGCLVKEGFVGAVKLEGGKNICPQVEKISSVGIPVMGHLGLTPQSVLAMGGFRVQGKRNHAPGMICTEEEIIESAHALVHAGIFSLVLEGVPERLGRKLSLELPVPVIGIGAGRYCDGQILVTHDLLGLSEKPSPRFVRRYAQLGKTVMEAVQQYGEDVREQSFPSEKEVYSAEIASAVGKEILQ